MNANNRVNGGGIRLGMKILGLNSNQPAVGTYCRQEPRRLWKRYLYNNPLFILKALLQVSGVSRYPL